MTKLQGLRDEYGDKKLVCDECGDHEVEVLELIEYFEENEGKFIFTPEKINDLAFTQCENCGLSLHVLRDKNDTKSSSKSEKEATEAQDPQDSEESTGSRKPFSL